ncbi:MAG: hypothetical protein QMB65_00700, partial [Vicingaceae bacterium]
MNQFSSHILVSIIVVFPFLGFAQQQNLPLNREFGLVNQKVFNSYESNVHTSFLPISQSYIKSISDTTLSNSERKFYLSNITKSEQKPRNFFGWMYRSMFFENLLVVDTGNFYLTIDNYPMKICLHAMQCKILVP